MNDLLSVHKASAEMIKLRINCNASELCSPITVLGSCLASSGAARVLGSHVATDESWSPIETAFSTLLASL